jgi:MFS transporter, putative metabolite:H+ symporter
MSQQSLLTRAQQQQPSVGARLDRLPIVRTHRMLTAAVGVGLFFDFFDSNLSGTIGKVLQADFGVSATSLKLILSSAFIGQFVGSIVFGRLADRLGRRSAFMLNLGVYSLFTLAGAFSPNAGFLIATRFLAGLGIGAETALADCYLAEMLPASRRGRFVAWAYTVGFLAVPAVGFAALWLAPRHLLGVDGWRILFVLGALGAAAVWVLRRKLIESPRWLAARGRHDEAEQLVAALESQARTPLPEPVADGSTVEGAGGLRVLLRKPYLRRTAMMWLFCVLSAVVYYGFGTLAPQVLAVKGFSIVKGLGFTALSFCGYPVGSLLSVPLMDRFERKRLLAGSAIATALAGLGFGYAGSGVVLVACGFLYTMLSNVFANTSHVYLSEQYPTYIRTSAAGAAYSLSRLSAGMLPFVLLPVLTHYGSGWLFGSVAIGVAVLCLDVLLLGDRTTGRPVDD